MPKKKTSSHLKAGSEFELELKRLFTAYRIEGRAVLEKVDPPSVRTRFGTTYKANPFLDFTGAWTERGGRALFLEAKTTTVPRLNLTEETNSGISPEQVTNLEKWEVAGGAVGVIWRHEGVLRWVTLNQIYAARADETKSVKWADAYKIPRGEGEITFDVLAVLRVLYPCAAH